MIHKIREQSLHWLKRLDTQLNGPTNQNSIKSPQSCEDNEYLNIIINFGDLCNKHSNVPPPPPSNLMHTYIINVSLYKI